MRRNLRRHAIVATLACVAMTVAACGSHAGGGSHTSTGYPNRAITIVSPFAAGSADDLTARAIATYGSTAWGQSIKVVNVVGASGVTGALQALKAPADGYTLLMDSPATASVLAAVSSKAPVTLDGRTYIGQVTSSPIYYIVNASSPYKTLQDVLDHAKQSPASFAWEGGSAGSAAFFVALELFQDAGVPTQKLKQVNFPTGIVAALQAVASGEVLFGTGSGAQVDSLAAAGKIRILAVAGKSRAADHPDVPSTSELGYADANLQNWIALAGPPNLPADVVSKWQTLITTGSTDPTFIKALAGIQEVPAYISGTQFTSQVNAEYQQILPLATSSGVRQ